MEVLVTGGAGYIGSVVVERLIEGNYKVVVFDNLEKGHREAVHPEANFAKGDLRSPDDIKAVFEENQIGAVIHLAAYTAVEESVSNPQKYFINNVGGSLNLLQGMLESDVKKIIFSSTAAVYGQPDKAPIEEEAPTRPESPYGTTKLIVEQLLSCYAQAYPLEFVSLRYFNAAGATKERGQDHRPFTHLIPRVIEVALGKRDHIDIYGTDYPTRDGTAIRDYIHISDLADAHVLALDTKEPLAIFNLGSGKGYSVKEVIEATREVSGKGIPAEEKGRRAGDPAELVASSDKIKSSLGWKPKYPELKEIVGSAWEWHKNHPLGYSSKALNSYS